jgi:hypothetical protein
VGALTGCLFDGFAFDDEGLSDVREVEVGVEFGGCPDAPCFDAAVVWRGELNEVGLLAILEVQRDVLFEGWLVGFDREVVIGAALDQVSGQLALGQQGVGGDLLVFDVDRVEQRNGGSDFVGLFDRFGIAVYRQGADFFWV